MARIDIKSDREFFREIYNKVEQGKYGVPAFQRDFVWNSTDIVDFFDSIWRGYPIGAIILWKPDIKMPTKDILTDEQRDAPEADYYVLDGRQRLTTFFGCVQNKRLREKKFELYFNLETETFSYKKVNDVLQILVADVYDTFNLLMKLQEITKHFADNSEKVRAYIAKANKLNAVLQGYTVSEIFIDGCGLDEAEVVFERVNSKGTDISKEFKLQALTYKRGGILVTEMIQDIKESLRPYHFETLKSDLIINCLYKFVGKNFYDAKITDLCEMDFDVQMPAVKSSIQKSVAFLHDECHVLSEKLLPYRDQLISLTWFFKVHTEPLTAEQKRTLRKWFVYTSYCKSFNNSSMSNIRPLYGQFDAYVNGLATNPITFMTVSEPKLTDGKFKHNDAHTDFVILSTVFYRKKINPSETIEYHGYFRLNSDSMLNYIICLTDHDRQDIENVLLKGMDYGQTSLMSLALTEEMIVAYRSGQYNLFKKLRSQYIVEMEKDFLRSCDIQFKSVL